MEVLYNNLYTHFVFTTKDRIVAIEEEHHDRIEKYISGIANNHGCKMYSIYANPEHVHFLVSRDPAMSEKDLAELIANASEIFINNNNFTNVHCRPKNKGIRVFQAGGIALATKGALKNKGLFFVNDWVMWLYFFVSTRKKDLAKIG